jgi:hypothetical protein
MSAFLGARAAAVARGVLYAGVFSLFAPVTFAASWQQSVDQIIGWKGQRMPDDVLRYTLTPHLNLTVAGVNTKNNLVLDGYAAFHAEHSGVLLVAEVVVPENNLDRTVETATGNSFVVSAVHNHVVKETPRVMFIHLSGFGDATTLAKNLKTVIASAGLSLHHDDDEQDADDVTPGLDVGRLESIMGASGTPVDGVLEFTFDRTESYSLGSHQLPPEMGPQSEIHFQSIGNGAAAQATELALSQSEVPTAERILRAHGQHIAVTALHNHFITEEPRLFFVHTWGVGSATELASAIREVINHTAQTPE